MLSELEKQQHVIEALTERVERMEGVATGRTGGRRSNTPQRPWSDQRPASAPQNLQTRRPFQERRAFQGTLDASTHQTGSQFVTVVVELATLGRQCRNEASTGPTPAPDGGLSTGCADDGPLRHTDESTPRRC